MTQSLLVERGHPPAAANCTVVVATDRVRLGRRGDFLLRIRHNDRVDRLLDDPGDWGATTASDAHRRLDLSERPVFSERWYTEGLSDVRTPHLHIEEATTPIDLSKTHGPSGFVSLPAVLRMTISDFGIEPRRVDWAALDDAERALTNA